MNENTKIKQILNLLGVTDEDIKICFAKNNDKSIEYKMALYEAITAGSDEERVDKCYNYYCDTETYAGADAAHLNGLIGDDEKAKADRKIEKLATEWDVDVDTLLDFIISPDFGAGF